MTNAVNHPLTHTPCLRRTIGVHPAAQIMAIEERNESIVIGSRRRAHRRHEKKQGKSFHDRSVTRPSHECTSTKVWRPSVAGKDKPSVAPSRWVTDQHRCLV